MRRVEWSVVCVLEIVECGVCVWPKGKSEKTGEGVIKYERGTKVEGTCSIKNLKI